MKFASILPIMRAVLVTLLVYFTHVNNCDRSEDDVEQVFEHIKAQQDGETIKTLSGRSMKLAGRSKIPSGNIFKEAVPEPLECGGSFNVAEERAIFWRMNSKHNMCYHAFIGSRASNCRVGILCDGSIPMLGPSSSNSGCDRDYIKITDGTVGQMFGCGKFTFNNIPRYALNNGTDLYVYYKAAIENPCVALCIEDLTENHDVHKPKTISANKKFMGLQSEPECKCGKRMDIGRVVGGEDVFKYELPWLVAIVWANIRGYDRIPFCGGTLINDRYIISAAHCFAPDNVKPWEIKVLLHAHVMDPKIKRGTKASDRMYMGIPGWDLQKMTDETEDTMRVEVESIVSHPLFTDETYDWDVAILKLKQRVNFKNKKVSPICLPLISEVLNYKAGDMHLVSGWGRFQETAVAGSRVPQKLEVPFVDHKKCTRYTVPSPRHMCAGYPTGKGDACQGDSGGPLIYKFLPATNQYVLTGVVSAGEGCARRGRVGVYTNTMEVAQWIYHYTADAIWCNR